jgi:hypothetical protein
MPLPFGQIASAPLLQGRIMDSLAKTIMSLHATRAHHSPQGSLSEMLKVANVEDTPQKREELRRELEYARLGHHLTGPFYNANRPIS